MLEAHKNQFYFIPVVNKRIPRGSNMARVWLKDREIFFYSPCFGSITLKVKGGKPGDKS